MRLRPGGVPVKWSVGWKFAAAVGAVVIGVLSVSITAEVGLIELRSALDGVDSGDVVDVRTAGDLTIDLYAVERAALAEAPPGPGRVGQSAVDQQLLPQLIGQLRDARGRFVDHPSALDRLNRVQADLDAFLALRRRDSTTTEPAGGPTPTARVAATFDRMTAETRALRDDEYAEATTAADAARATYRSTQQQLVIGTVVSLLVALALVSWLVRNMVPRMRAYADFAAEFAAGRRVGNLDPRGSDELAELGRSLDHMVAVTEAARRRDLEQVEFVDTLQVTANEEEAHELVQRHLERSLPGSDVVVFRRNNSKNRLETATALRPDSPLTARLPLAEPRSCLALRFGRTHREDPTRTPLLSCTLCGDHETRTTCEPLLVAGQVIGAVLTTHRDALADSDEARIKNSVAQSAPVVGNLRNLALAEFRANNDSLTGLPNKRATDDTLKRMVAQANRSVTPLAAAMLDLDHFKQVNDRFGHAKGDEVLAAVGAALRSTLRTSDFAGRFGGEELLVLLPETTAEDALALTERIRTTVAAIRVPGVERAITVSIGVADLIQHGGDAPGLLRSADRALYTAKARGRNRVVIAGAGDADAVAVEAPADDPIVIAQRDGLGTVTDSTPG